MSVVQTRGSSRWSPSYPSPHRISRHHQIHVCTGLWIHNTDTQLYHRSLRGRLRNLGRRWENGKQEEEKNVLKQTENALTSTTNIIGFDTFPPPAPPYHSQCGLHSCLSLCDTSRTMVGCRVFDFCYPDCLVHSLVHRRLRPSSLQLSGGRKLCLQRFSHQISFSG